MYCKNQEIFVVENFCSPTRLRNLFSRIISKVKIFLQQIIKTAVCAHHFCAATSWFSNVVSETTLGQATGWPGSILALHLASMHDSCVSKPHWLCTLVLCVINKLFVGRWPCENFSTQKFFWQKFYTMKIFQFTVYIYMYMYIYILCAINECLSMMLCTRLALVLLDRHLRCT